MDPAGILAIITAFFNAIRGVLEAMGILEKKTESAG